MYSFFRDGKGQVARIPNVPGLGFFSNEVAGKQNDSNINDIIITIK